jgi:uncharacterized protein
MPSAPIRASIGAIRRLAVTKQHLAGRRPARASRDRVVATIRDLPYVQWDPVTVVAPSHLLSLWARVGAFPSAELDRLLWRERRLLQHWIPFAALVPTDDLPLHSSFMRRYPESLSDSWGAQRAAARAFLAKHRDLRKRVLADLAAGPLTVGQFSDHARTRRDAGDWEPASAVSEMLWHLLMSGKVMVVGHEGNQNVWGLAEAFLPAWADRRELSVEEGERRAAERALGALGVATAREIQRYFIRGCYRDIDETLGGLLADGRIDRVEGEGDRARGEQYVHAEDVSLLTALETKELPHRIAFLPPFDNMIFDQGRGRRVFDFDYVREQFLPKEKRRFGTWVLPILRGDRFIGRMDARLDKPARRLEVLGLFAERDAPEGATIAAELRDELDRLATFLDADSVSFSPKVPRAWRGIRS